MGEETTPQLHKDRNKILVKYAEHSFSAALDDINEALKSEKNHGKKLSNKLPNGPPEGSQNDPRSTKDRRQDAINFCINFGTDFCSIWDRFRLQNLTQNGSRSGICLHVFSKSVLDLFESIFA